MPHDSECSGSSGDNLRLGHSAGNLHADACEQRTDGPDVPRGGARRVSEPRLEPIPPDMLQEVFPLIHKHLANAIGNSKGRWTFRSVLDKVNSRDWELLAVVDGAEIKAVLAVNIYNIASGARCCEIPFCVGDASKSWVHLIAEVEAYARRNGCIRMELSARKGWAKRLPDYRIDHVFLEKELV